MQIASLVFGKTYGMFARLRNTHNLW